MVAKAQLTRELIMSINDQRWSSDPRVFETIYICLQKASASEEYFGSQQHKLNLTLVQGNKVTRVTMSYIHAGCYSIWTEPNSRHYLESEKFPCFYFNYKMMQN